MEKVLHVLYAEDYDDDAVLFRNAAQHAAPNMAVHLVRDGDEAIDYLEGKGEFADRLKHPVPSVILLDIKMPRLGGLEVLRWIRSRPEYRRTPVIMFSGSELPQDISQAYDLGASSYMPKPGATTAMHDIVKLLDDFWRTHSRLPDSPSAR